MTMKDFALIFLGAAIMWGIMWIWRIVMDAIEAEDDDL